MSIGFVLPCMRPIMVDRVLHDLQNQTLKPDFVILVDNSTKYVRKEIKYDYDLQIVRPGKNIGTNQAWNIALRLNADYCGFVGDDYRLDYTMIEKLVYGLCIKHGPSDVMAGATVPTLLQQRKRTPPENTHIKLEQVKSDLLKTGKGQSAAVLMRKRVAHDIPEIPKCFKIFFGDNWISYHIIHKMKLGWVRMDPCHIYHIPGPTNVSAKLNYRVTLRNERRLWNKLFKKI